MTGKLISRFILAIFSTALIFSGCRRHSPSVTDDSSYGGLLAQADSLIDISPDSTLVLCRSFFMEYPDAADSLRARARLIEGNAYFSLGDLTEARNAMSEAKTIASRCGDTYTCINATADLGVAMRVSQQPDSALTLYNEALAMIGDNNSYADEKAHLLTSIAILFANTGHLDEARDYADKAVAASKESGDPDLIMYATSQAGAIYNLMGDREMATRLSYEALADARRQGLPRYELKALGHIIDIHLRENRLDSVDFYLRRGEELARLFPETSVEGLGFLEEKYVVLAAMGRYRESLAVQKRLMRLQDCAPTFMPPEKLWLRMARNYRGLNMPDSAAICYERAFEVSDSLRGEDTDRQLSEFYARFKTTEKEIALANMERRKARSDMWLAIATGIIVALAATVAAGTYYVKNRRRKERLTMLRSHINGIEQERGRLAKDLHDGICNDLYGIEMLLQTDTSREELLCDVEKIRSEVRRISHEMMPPSLLDIGLDEALRDMLAKMEHAYPRTKFVCSSISGPEHKPLSNHISYSIYRICQELTGNIMRHANPANLKLSLDCGMNEFILTISHDGATAANISDSNGIGIESIRQRLASIDATASGFPFAKEIKITCPLR